MCSSMPAEPRRLNRYFECGNVAGDRINGWRQNCGLEPKSSGGGSVRWQDAGCQRSRDQLRGNSGRNAQVREPFDFVPSRRAHQPDDKASDRLRFEAAADPLMPYLLSCFGANPARLAKIARRYDPQVLFTQPQP